MKVLHKCAQTAPKMTLGIFPAPSIIQFIYIFVYICFHYTESTETFGSWAEVVLKGKYVVEHCKGHRHHIYGLRAPQVPNFNPFHSKVNHFPAGGSFEKGALNDSPSKQNLNQYEVKSLPVYGVYFYAQVPNVSSFFSMAKMFRAAGNFREDHRMSK